MRDFINDKWTNDVVKSVYPYNEMSIQELLNRFYSEIKKTSEISNQALKFLEWLVEKGVKDETIAELNRMYNDGRLEQLVNIDKYNTLNDRITDEVNTINVDADKTYYNVESGYVYEPGIIELDGAWDNFYSTGALPKVGMTNDGTLKFSGNIKLKNAGIYNFFTDGSILIGKITNIPITDKEGIPLRGQITCAKSTGGLRVLPITLQLDGSITTPNTGGLDDEYYFRMDFSGLTINTMNFGEHVVRDKVDKVVNIALSRNYDYQALYYTDMHFNLAKMNTHSRNLKYINYIDNLLDLDNIISGGDNIIEPYLSMTNPGIKQSIVAHKTIYKSYKPNKFVYCNGNHDNNYLQGNSQTIVFPHHIKKYFGNKNVIWGGDNKYYGYVDNPLTNTRVVIFDTVEDDGVIHGAGARVSAEQLNWIAKNALNMRGKSNWKVLFIGHILPLDDNEITHALIPTRVAIRNVIKAFKNGLDVEVVPDELIRFSEQGPQTVVGWLGGHNHKDTITIVEGVNYITTLLAWSESVSGSPRAYAHTWELCFDIISIDSSERKMYLDRVGRGESRVISY